VKAQQGIVVQNFRVEPERYPPPNERQAKSLLEGSRAEPLPGGRLEVSGARLQTFRTNGQVEMVVVAPRCEFDQSTRSVRSAGPISVKTADGSFSIEGEGFLWQQTTSFLAISNRVVTVIEPELLQANAKGANADRGTGQVRVLADQFSYGADTGLGVYRGGVRVESTNLLLTAELLSFLLPMKERLVRTVTAEQNVILDYEGVLEGIHATGERAIYSAQSGLVQVYGKPTWRAGRREGRGDQITIDRTNQVFISEGNGYLKMPAENPAGSGFLGRFQDRADSAGRATTNYVEISSANYVLRTNLAEFDQNVRVREFAGEETKGTLNCGRLTLNYAGTNQLQRMTAERGVTIEQEDKELRGEVAVYDSATTMLEVRGAPSWRVGEREGRGETILVNTVRDEMTVRNAAWMKLPAGELGQVSGGLRSGSIAATSAMTNRFAEVFAEQYTLAPELITFAGKVRIEHPQMAWNCDLLTVKIPSAPQAERKIVAEPLVTFELKAQNGQTLKGRGERAVYTQRALAAATNSMIELMGTPAMLETTNGMVVRNRVLVLDLARGKFIVPPGGYRIAGPTNMLSTNIFRMSGKRPGKAAR
jgi:lipopolysaccharide export system protein LptA